MRRFNIPLPTPNDFKITIPKTMNLNWIWILLVAIIIIYPILGISTPEAILSVIILFLILYVIFNSVTTNNPYNEIPSTLYPYNPHLGLDGISMSSYVAGMDTKKYV